MLLSFTITLLLSFATFSISSAARIPNDFPHFKMPDAPHGLLESLPAFAAAGDLNPLCMLCEMIVHKLENIIGTNWTEAAVEKALESVCDLLPGSLSQDCEDFVHQYGPRIVSLLLSFSPAVVCTALGICLGSAGGQNAPLIPQPPITGSPWEDTKL
uniref:prosaposin-like n=1 Tax=Myxine glutinosa TaxID=7769 RepID=UPI00358F9EBE